MQKFRSIYRYTGFSAIVASMMLISCINDSSLCPIEVDEEEQQITFEFTVITRDLARNGTRALEIPPSTQNGTMAENYLDLNNTTFLLFDKNETLIKVFVPYVDPVKDKEYAEYTVRAFMSPEEFHTLTDGKTEVTADGKTEVTFSIAVVGNYSLLGPKNAAYHIGQKMDEIFDPAKVATFEMPKSNNWSNNWMPSIYPGGNGQASGQIPMAGIQTYTVPVDDLIANKPYNLSKDINMLRALAKIEIVDRIDYESVDPGIQPDIYNRTWIEKVELVGFSERGSLFPSFGQWNLNGIVETQYVKEPSWINSYGYKGAIPSGSTLTIADDTALVNFFIDAAATEARDDQCRVFSCYLTEYKPEALTVNDPKMWIRVQAHGPGEGTEPADNNALFYRIEVAPYTNGKPGDAMPILRNNIYRYEITGLTPELDLSLKVDDWHPEEISWSYKANPAMAEEGEIEWIDILQSNLNPNTARVVCTYGQDLTATFTFKEPEGGTWTARLVTQSGDSKAFTFVGNDNSPLIDEEGFPLEISGSINGGESTIKIRPMLEPGPTSREARLIFTVLTPDGRTVPANVLGTKYNGNTFFTIVQNASL